VPDLSGRGHVPALHVKAGEAAFVQTSEGDALRLAAPDDRIEAPFAAFPGPKGSLRMRVRFESLDQRQTLFRIYSKTGDGMQLALQTNGRVRFSYYRRAEKKWIACEFAASLLRENRWHEIVAAWDFDGDLALFLDGQPRGARALRVRPSFPNDAVMVFGNDHAFGSPLRGAFRLIEMSDQPGGSSSAALPELKPGSPRSWCCGPLAVTFDDRHGSVLEVAHDGLKLASADQATPLWEIELRAEQGLGRPILLAPQLVARVGIADQGPSLRLRWEDIPLPEDESKVSVQVLLEPGPEEGLCSWRIAVDNPSKKYGIWEVRFPYLVLAPLDDDLARHQLITPSRWGEARPDPWATADRSAPAEIHCRCNYPSVTMQFAALSGPPGHATYLACYDGQNRLKETWLDIFTRRKRIEYHVNHYPDNMGAPGESYRQPYPLVVGHVAGDWFDVCQTYRRWALQQRWTALGPLATRRDVPEWYKRCAVVLRQQIKRNGQPVDPSRDNALRAAVEIPGASMGIWYGWNHKLTADSGVPAKHGEASLSSGAGWDWQPAAGVPEAARQMAAAGHGSTAYINTRLYDSTDRPPTHPLAQWALPYVVRDVAGQPDFYDRTANLWDMCRWTEGWQDRYCRNCEVAMRAGFRGIYMDSFGRGNPLCFAAEHGHSRGGGSTMVDGQRRFAQVVRERIRAIDPEAITTGEAPIEAFIDMIDGNLFHFNMPRHFAPLFTAVYHDYQLCYGRTVGPAPPTDPTYWMQVGRLFTEGVQIGRFFIDSPTFFLWQPEYRAELDYLKRCAEAKLAAHEYLNLGQFMRPPVIESPLPTLESDYQNIHTVMPAVLIRAWKSHRGTVAHTMTNLTDQAQEFTYCFSTADYGFPSGSRLVWRQLYPASSENESLTAGHLRRTLRLEPRAVRVVEVVGSE